MSYSGSPISSQTSHTTHPTLHIRDARDAHILLEAVRRKILPLITRRLSTSERDKLTSGNVFVWEEADFKGGLERWTDGRRWSQSRMRGDYLFYEEKIETTQEEREVKAARRARRALDPTSVPPLPNRRQDRPSKPDGLTKQTYSTLVYLPGSSTPRKWHIVAYFRGNDYSRLPVVENYDYLRNLTVAEGIFVSNRAAQKPLTFTSVSDDDDEGSCSPRQSQVSPSPSSSPILNTVTPPYSYTSQGATSYYAQASSLPRLSSILPAHGGMVNSVHHHASPAGRQSTQQYAPLSAEDRRVLSSFRVVL